MTLRKVKLFWVSCKLCLSQYYWSWHGGGGGGGGRGAEQSDMNDQFFFNHTSFVLFLFFI